MPHPPGVFFESADLGPGPVSVRTDVAGIIGLAERGPVGLPVAIESHTQFVTVFGAPRSDLHLGWCVRGFFENGGQRAWVCRAAGDTAAPAMAELGAAGAPAFRLSASSSGVWGDELEITLTESGSVETLATGLVEDGRVVAVADTTEFATGDLIRLSQPAGATAHRVVNAVDHVAGRLTWAAGDPALALPTDVPLAGIDPALPLLVTRLRYGLTVVRRGVILGVHGNLGIVPGGPRYVPDVIAGLPAALAVEDLRPVVPGVPAPLDPQATLLRLGGGRDGHAQVTTGDLLACLRGFDLLSEPAIFLIPDLHEPGPPPRRVPNVPDSREPCLDCPPPPPPLAVTPLVRSETPPGFSEEAIARAQHALLDWCAARPNAFAVLDLPRSIATRATEGQRLLAWRRRFDSAFGALYFPWLALPQDDRQRPARPTPSAGHVAGQIAARDLSDGVHHAPANLRLSWVQATAMDVRPELHGLLNDNGLNVIRTSSGRGIRVMGARTLSNDPGWRFVATRRLMSMIGHALSLSSRWAIFEPDDFATRGKLGALYTAFLTAIWRRGGLAGADPSEAFVVIAREPAAEALGRLTMTVAVAPLNPLEFIVFRIGREEGSISVDTSVAGRLEGAA